MSSIGRGFDRASSSIYQLLAHTGGIRPPGRTRSRLALTLAEREEISKGIYYKAFAALHRPCFETISVDYLSRSQAQWRCPPLSCSALL